MVSYRIRLKYGDILRFDFWKPKNGDFNFFQQIIQNFAWEYIFNFQIFKR